MICHMIEYYDSIDQGQLYTDALSGLLIVTDIYFYVIILYITKLTTDLSTYIALSVTNF